MSSSPPDGSDPVALTPAGDGEVSLEALAGLRQAAYRLFGGVLLYPDAEWRATLPGVARELPAVCRPFAAFAFRKSWERFLGALEKVESADRAELESAYARHFLPTSEGIACPPCESAHRPRESVGWLMAELDRQYAHAGFAVDPDSEEPADHVAVELEFMGMLCAVEAEAWRERRVADGIEQLDLEAGFLAQHLGRWFPAFAGRLARQDPVGFYGIAAEAAGAFLGHEADLLGILRARFGEVGDT